MNIPDWSERSWRSAAYPYAAPDAPEEYQGYHDDYDERADEYDDLEEGYE